MLDFIHQVKENWRIMPKLAANLSWLFSDLAFKDRFAAAASAGFKGVECLFPYEYPTGDLAALLDDHGLQQVLINAPPGDWERGERGLGCLPGRQDDFRAAIELAIDYAGALKCPRIHAMAGIAPRNDQSRDILLENLAVAAQLCGRAGIRLLIEPINGMDMPGYYLNTPDQAAVLIERVASPHLSLQFDIYHVAMAGLDLGEQIERHFSLIDHFQIAGKPGRKEPVNCDIDTTTLFRQIDGLGYDGRIGCEYNQTRLGFSWARDYGIKNPARP